jgi:hypothetical protein
MIRLIGPLLAMASIFAIALPASAADLPDPCALLAPDELSALGMPKGAVAGPDSKEDGRFLICNYRPADQKADPSPAAESSSITSPSVVVMIASAGNDRVLQLRAMIAKARGENSPAQLQARGEYYADTTSSANSVPMCKVQIEGGVEASRCLSATDTNIVTLIVGRRAPEGGALDPSRQLRLISELAARVRAKGG